MSMATIRSTWCSVSNITPIAVDDNVSNLYITLSYYDYQTQEVKFIYPTIDLPSITGTSTYVTFTKLKGEGVASGSGSSSVSTQKLVKLTFTDLDMRTYDSDNADINNFKMYCTKERWDNFVALAKSIYSIDITYSNFETFFKNATFNGQSLAIGYLLYDYITDVALPNPFVINKFPSISNYGQNALFTTEAETVLGNTEEVVIAGSWLGDIDFPSADRSSSVPYATSSTTVTIEEIDSNVMASGSGSDNSSSNESALDTVIINLGPSFTGSTITFTFEKTKFNAFLNQISTLLSHTITRDNFNTVANQFLNDTNITNQQKLQLVVAMATCQISSYYYYNMDGFLSNNLSFGLTGIHFNGTNCNIFDNTDSSYDYYGFVSIELS